MASSIPLVRRTGSVSVVKSACDVYRGLDACTENHQAISRAAHIEGNGWACDQRFPPCAPSQCRNDDIRLQMLAMLLRIDHSPGIQQHMETQEGLDLSRTQKLDLTYILLQRTRNGRTSWNNSNDSTSLLKITQDWNGYRQKRTKKIEGQCNFEFGRFQDLASPKFRCLPPLFPIGANRAFLSEPRANYNKPRPRQPTHEAPSCMQSVHTQHDSPDVLAFTGSLFTETIGDADLARLSDELADVLDIDDRLKKVPNQDQSLNILRSASAITDEAASQFDTWTYSESKASLTTATTVWSGSAPSCEGVIALYDGGNEFELEEWSIPALTNKISNTFGDAGSDFSQLARPDTISDYMSGPFPCSLFTARDEQDQDWPDASGHWAGLHPLWPTNHTHGMTSQPSAESSFVIESVLTASIHICLNKFQQVYQVCTYGRQEYSSSTTVDIESVQKGNARMVNMEDRKPLKQRKDSRESDGGSEDRSRRPSQMKSQTRGRRLWACPYFKKDPRKYERCSRHVLSGINRVKQHLHRYHVRAASPPHGRSPAQPPNGNPSEDCNDEGMNQRQIARLRTRASRRIPEEQQWFQLWDIIFPFEPTPESPFVQAESVEAHKSLSPIYQAGSEIIDDVLRDEGISPEISRRIINRLHERVQSEICLSVSPQQALGPYDSTTAEEPVDLAPEAAIAPASSTSLDDYYSTFSHESSSTTLNTYNLPTTFEPERPNRTDSGPNINTTRYLQEPSPWTALASTPDYDVSREFSSIPSTTTFGHYLPNIPPIFDVQLDNTTSRAGLAYGSGDTAAYLPSSSGYEFEGLDRGEVCYYNSVSQ